MFVGGIGIVRESGHAEELCDDSGAIVFDCDFGREKAMDGIEGDLFDGTIVVSLSSA